MSAARSLLGLEMKRSIGLLCFPFLLVVAWLFVRAGVSQEVYVWFDTSNAVRNTVLFVGPFVGGISAWMASRSRRRGVGELLSITPHSPALRDLTLWAGTAFWGVAVYLLLAVVQGSLTYLNATWGGPTMGYFLIGLLGIVADSAIGFAAGHYLPSRFTAPLVAIALLTAHLVPLGMVGAGAAYGLFSPAPYSNIMSDAFEKLPQATLQQSLWFVGLAGISLSSVALKDRRVNKVALVALAASVAICVTGIVTILRVDSDIFTVAGKPVPYEPVCEKGRITVCVHPAYAKLLPETTKAVNKVATPLVGVPGAPTRVVQEGSSSDQPRGGKNVAPFGLESMTNGGEASFKGDIALDLVMSGSTVNVTSASKPTAEDLKRCGGGSRSNYYDLIFSTQIVVGAWLSERTDADTPPWMLSTGCPSVDKLTERFAKLDSAKRHAWLKENFAALRDGKLTLKDLP